MASNKSEAADGTNMASKKVDELWKISPDEEVIDDAVVRVDDCHGGADAADLFSRLWTDKIGEVPPCHTNKPNKPPPTPTTSPPTPTPTPPLI